MFTDTEFKDFMQKHKDEILNNDWESIYDDLPSYKDVSNLTDFLLNKVHINPLYYMTSVPIYFAYNLDIPSINIPNNVTSIGRYAFENCSKLTSITISNSVRSIGSGAFYNCTGLTSINIPDGVTSIEDYAFWDCTSLTSVTIPSSVTEIGYGAFQNCSSLTSITIPNSVKMIRDDAFTDCDNLKEIKYNGTESEWNALLSKVKYLLKFIQQRNIKVIFI